MSLENTSTQELIELENLFYGDDATYEEWFDAFKDEDQIRKELIEMLVLDILDKGYDGPNDYHAIYWFVKGLNLPAPQAPKRYVDSDDYLFKHIHKYKIHDKLNDLKRQRLHERFNRNLHKKDSSFLNELMEHQKKLSEFQQTIRNLPDDDLDGIG